MAIDRSRTKLRQLERLLRPRAAAIRDQTHALAVAVEELRAASALMRDATSRMTGTPVSPPGPPVIDERNARYDRQTIEIMRRVLAPDSNVIDVGAHAGSVLEQIVALAPEGTHAAFEPIGSLAAALRERFPSVEVHEMALSDTAGETTFHHVVSNPSYSGILKRRFDRDHEDVEIVTVPVGRLDDVIPADRPVKLLKIDVEGAELGVLRGGEKLITSHKPYVVFEHGLGGSDIYGTEPGTVYDLLEGWGLRISLLDDWLHSRPPLTRDAFVEQFVECINYYFLAHPG